MGCWVMAESIILQNSFSHDFAPPNKLHICLLFGKEIEKNIFKNNIK
jgi:hypothetical protein